MPTAAWDAHRGVLASRLDARSWEAVATAVSSIKQVEAHALRHLATAPEDLGLG